MFLFPLPSRQPGFFLSSLTASDNWVKSHFSQSGSIQTRSPQIAGSLSSVMDTAPLTCLSFCRQSLYASVNFSLNSQIWSSLDSRWVLKGGLKFLWYILSRSRTLYRTFHLGCSLCGSIPPTWIVRFTLESSSSWGRRIFLSSRCLFYRWLRKTVPIIVASPWRCRQISLSPVSVT